MMKKKQYPLWIALITGCLFLSACGEDKDPRLSDADAMCLKMIRMGGSCGGASGGSGSSTTTTTATVTQTVTNTSTN
jgi:hypothetical protein